MRNSLFIVLEGTDRVGKSTQAKLLADALTDKFKTDTFLVRFPDRSTVIGEILSNYLSMKVEIDPHAVHLLFTANRWELASKIKEALSVGRCVVADRYSYSGIVYTASKEPNTPDWDWIVSSEDGLPQPDLIICLLPKHIKDLTNRGGFGDERFDYTDFQSRVMVNYRRLADQINKKTALNKKGSRWEWFVCGNLSPEEIHQLLMETIADCCPAIKSVSTA